MAYNIQDPYRRTVNGTNAAARGVVSPTGYNISPAPTRGQGAHGMVPGQIGLPDVAAQLEAQLPGADPLKQEISRGLMADLRGELAPSTIGAIQEGAAAWGAGAGVPGSGLAVNRGLRDIGLTAEGQRRAAIADYQNQARTVSETETIRPETQINTALQNAINRASPDPAAAASYAESLFNRYLNRTAGAGVTRPQAVQEMQIARKPGGFFGDQWGTSRNVFSRIR